VHGASVNRSPEAYDKNPLEERQQYDENVDSEMVLLRIDDVDGKPLGMLNWFAVHPTSLGNDQRLISGDNKGLAAYEFERSKMGVVHRNDVECAFVGAFAQSTCGDVSPNVEGPRDGTDWLRMRRNAHKQLTVASELYDAAIHETPIDGVVMCCSTVVDYSAITVDPAWLSKDVPCNSTSVGCIGTSMMGGSTLDGKGLSFVPDGITFGGDWPISGHFTLVPEWQTQHAEKMIGLPSGPMGLTPHILQVHSAHFQTQHEPP
jgi:neutral ceramidase